MRRVAYAAGTAAMAVLFSCGIPPQSPPVAREGWLAVTAGVRLHYRVVGTGSDTVIVLHGGPGLHASYLEAAMDPLATGRVLIYYDQRGRGLSDAAVDTSDWTAARDVADLDSLRRFFGLSRVTLLGHHWGAVLAALYARRYPEHVDRLLLVSPSFPHASYLFWAATLLKSDQATTAYLDAIRAGADTADPHAFCARFWGFLLNPTPVVAPDLVREFEPAMCDAPAEALQRSWRVNRLVAGSLHGLNLRDTLRTISVPLLVIAGVGDSASTESMRAWTTWAPDARELVLPAPALFPWTRSTARFRRAAAEFLDGRWPEGAE